MTRVELLAGLVLVLAPSPAFAHGTGGSSSGGSGISFPLLLGGIALLAAGLALRAKLPTPAAWGAVAVGVAFGIGSLFAGGKGGEPADVHLSITQPAGGATVLAGEIVEVRVQVDGDLATGPSDKTGGHLHLFVDGQLQQMPYAATSEVTLDPGRHTLTVEYVDNQHLSYDPSIQDSVEVEAE